MMIRCTVFLATLVQDSALSVSGLDPEDMTRRNGSALPDNPFTIVDGQPVLAGRGLKGAAVAMARRFFDPLPRVVSENLDTDPDPSRRRAFRHSAWEFANARQLVKTEPRDRNGVGIRLRTGARARGILYDCEVTPAGTRWSLVIECIRRVRHPPADAVEAEGILSYVLSEHWAKGRCWLGGGVARGLGWCHIEDLSAHRLDGTAWKRWTDARRGAPNKDPSPIAEIRKLLPQAEPKISTVEPTRGWCFREREVALSFGEYRPEPGGVAWGVDMLAVGTHDRESGHQPIGNGGTWAQPPWAPGLTGSDAFDTDRAMAMEGATPLLPGSAVRGPLRHAFSRRRTAQLGSGSVADTHEKQGDVGKDDPAGKVFGTTLQSSRVLICDSRAESGWCAAKLQQHAEDEFTAGSFETAKRDAVRLLKGAFRVRMVVDAPSQAEADKLTAELDPIIALGAIGHLPVGGHKTRGAGWGRWEADQSAWTDLVIAKKRDWTENGAVPQQGLSRDDSRTGLANAGDRQFPKGRKADDGRIVVESIPLSITGNLSLGDAARKAREYLNDKVEVGWWCEAAIDFEVQKPRTFGLGSWPEDNDPLAIDEAVFFADSACSRVARTAKEWRVVVIREIPSGRTSIGEPIDVAIWWRPARLHADKTRFDADLNDKGDLILREWRLPETLEIVGYTIETPEQRA